MAQANKINSPLSRTPLVPAVSQEAPSPDTTQTQHMPPWSALDKDLLQTRSLSEAEPWRSQFSLESNSQSDFDTLLEANPQGRYITAADESPEFIDRKPEPSQNALSETETQPIDVISDAAKLTANLTNQQEEELMTLLVQIMYTEVKSHVYQLRERQYGKSYSLCEPASFPHASYPSLAFHQLATVVRQHIEARLQIGYP